MIPLTKQLEAVKRHYAQLKAKNHHEAPIWAAVVETIEHRLACKEVGDLMLGKDTKSLEVK